MTRRDFAAAATAAAFVNLNPPPASAASSSTPFPVHFVRTSPRDALVRYVEPGSDAFAGEKDALEIEERLRRIFAGAEAPPASLHEWAARRTEIRWARFHVLPDARVRFEIAIAGKANAKESLEHHTGLWALPDFTPLESNSIASPAPWFRDVTAHAFAGAESFNQQLLQGNPWWRSRLDSAAGIDVDGNQGVAVADIDNDGVDEIYICQPGGLPNRLYKIGPDGTAQDITRKAGLDILDETTCALFADFRNSGLQDLVVLRRSGPLLFLNQGNGVFRERPDAFRFRRPPRGAFTGMSTADYDRDGRLDLYLCTYVYVQGEDLYQYPSPYHDARNGPPNYLFHSRAEPDGPVFDDVTEESGIDENNNRFSFAASWCDFDGDGWPDLYVANDFGKNNLYRNRNGRFTDEAAHAGVEDIGAGMSASWFDYDGDGLPDLYISNMWTAAGQRIVRDPAFAPAAGNEDAYRRHTKGNSLYRNRGDGMFEETGPTEGVEMGRWAWSSGGFDFDLDGSPEILIATGMVSNGAESTTADLESFFWRQVVARSPQSGADAGYENGWNAIGQLFREDFSWNSHEPNVFYVRRDGRYVDASGVSGLDFAEDSRAFAVTDFDGDGYPDIVLKSRLGPQVRILRNHCAAGRPAIALRLRGTKSNRDAIGARVTVNGHMQEITAGSGFLSQHSKRLHFGLGGRVAADVRIVWPSGLTQEIAGLKPGFTWTIVEGSANPTANLTANLTKVPFRPRVEYPTAHLTARNFPEFADTWLLEPIPDPGGHPGPSIVILYAGEAPTARSLPNVLAIDLAREPDEAAAAYALLHRYIFEYRSALSLPLALLVDSGSRVRKVYATIPPESAMRADFDTLRTADPARLRSLALPFPGRYFKEPSRNYFKIGIAFYWAGYPKRALPFLEESLRSTPDHWRTMLALGEIHRELGNPDASLTAFKSALSLQPSHVGAMVSVGISLLAKNDQPGARAMFAKALETDPHSAEAANQLGLLEVRSGNAEQARQLFERAIEAQPSHSGALNNLGVLFAQKGQYNDSIAVFRYGIAKLPDDEPLHLNLARVLAMAGQRESAISILKELLEQKPTSVPARKFLDQLINQ